MARVENHQPKDLGKGAAKPSTSLACLEIEVKVTTISWTNRHLNGHFAELPLYTASHAVHEACTGVTLGGGGRSVTVIEKIGFIDTYKLLGKRPNLVNGSPANG
ncbi:uncharacterized protein LOC143376144 [Andrena cerasifolii]|uniref:uncharacterized protein LOC143376144 n=1 Tax=Andrena cerasifolii TaxID=2819439 RepID=UPI0040384D3D